MVQYRYSMIKIICKQCKKEFEDYKSNNRIFCSKKCYQNNFGELPKCLNCSAELKRRNRKLCVICRDNLFRSNGIKTRFTKGFIPWNKGNGEYIKGEFLFGFTVNLVAILKIS